MRRSIGNCPKKGAGALLPLGPLARMLALGLCAGLLLPQEALAGPDCLRDPARIQELRQLDEARVSEQQKRHGQAKVPPRIHALARRLQAASEVLRQKPPVRVLGYSHPGVGAHAADHGMLVIASGIWSKVHAFTDDEIAAVLAHELAHIEMRHSLEEGCAAVVRMASPDGPMQDALSTLNIELFNASSELASTVRSELHQRELHADVRGAQLLELAGFRPHAMQRLLIFIGDLASQQGTGFGRGGHPTAQLRVAAVQAELLRMMSAPLLNAAGIDQPRAND